MSDPIADLLAEGDPWEFIGEDIDPTPTDRWWPRVIASAFILAVGVAAVAAILGVVPHGDHHRPGDVHCETEEAHPYFQHRWCVRDGVVVVDVWERR